MNQLSSAINGLLGLRGLEFRAKRRTISDLKSYPQLATSGRIVELVGAQAIGKSTLNNALHESLKNRWFFRYHLQQTGPISNRSYDIEKLHHDIYYRKLDRVCRPQKDAWKSIATSRQMARVICESMMISSYAFPRGFFLDEGLFKNFPDEMLELSSEEAKPLWKNRAFIYVRARDPDFAATRFQNRITERKKHGLFQHPQTYDEIHSRIQKDNILFDKLFERAQSFSCPSIIVYAEDSLQNSVKNTLEFERALVL